MPLGVRRSPSRRFCPDCLPEPDLHLARHAPAHPDLHAVARLVHQHELRLRGRIGQLSVRADERARIQIVFSDPVAVATVDPTASRSAPPSRPIGSRGAGAPGTRRPGPCRWRRSRRARGRSALPSRRCATGARIATARAACRGRRARCARSSTTKPHGFGNRRATTTLPVATAITGCPMSVSPPPRPFQSSPVWIPSGYSSPRCVATYQPS